jgi:hypothetical protein
MRVAVPPVTQPPQAKPTTMVATMQAAHDHNQTALEGRYDSHRLPTLGLVTMVPRELRTYLQQRADNHSVQQWTKGKIRAHSRRVTARALRKQRESGLG